MSGEFTGQREEGNYNGHRNRSLVALEYGEEPMRYRALESATLRTNGCVPSTLL